MISVLVVILVAAVLVVLLVSVLIVVLVSVLTRIRILIIVLIVVILVILITHVTLHFSAHAPMNHGRMRCAEPDSAFTRYWTASFFCCTRTCSMSPHCFVMLRKFFQKKTARCEITLQRSTPQSVGSSIPRSIHFMLPVSFRMVRQVVAQGK